jgi:hypothetical protein
LPVQRIDCQHVYGPFGTVQTAPKTAERVRTRGAAARSFATRIGASATTGASRTPIPPQRSNAARDEASFNACPETLCREISEGLAKALPAIRPQFAAILSRHTTGTLTTFYETADISTPAEQTNDEQCTTG